MENIWNLLTKNTWEFTLLLGENQVEYIGT